jgi:hypothetical protein
MVGEFGCPGPFLCFFQRFFWTAAGPQCEAMTPLGISKKHATGKKKLMISVSFTWDIFTG